MAQSTQYIKTQYGAETSAYGTEASSYTELQRVQNCDIQSNNGFIYGRGLGEGFNAVSTLYGPFKASGSITFFPTEFSFLKHWIGNKSGAGTSGDKYILTEASSIRAGAEAATYLVPFSLERTNDDTSTTVDFATGCVGTSFTLTAEMNKQLSCNANFIAQKSGHRATGETYTPDTTAAFIMLGGSWKWGATPSSLTGVQNFTINYNNGLVGENDETRSLESRFIGIPHLGTRSYTGTVGILMAQSLASSILNDFYGSESSGTYLPNDASSSSSPTSSLEFTADFINGSRYATIQLDEASIDRISKPAAVGNGLVVLTFEFTARKGKNNAPISWWST